MISITTYRSDRRNLFPSTMPPRNTEIFMKVRLMDGAAAYDRLTLRMCGRHGPFNLDHPLGEFSADRCNPPWLPKSGQLPVHYG
jgi:hypothetical protein